MRYSTAAFSLVELSIVLVILGLLTGGILGGQSLIRAAELRSVSTEEQRYAAAIHTFRDKYFQLPGDFNSATRFWGRQNTNADCITNNGAAVNSSTGTCDGNGSSVLDGGAQGQSSELFQLWRQLALAGLIEGTYDGIYGASSSPTMNPGNSPRSKLGTAYWQTGHSTAPLTGHGGIFDRPAVQGTFQIGAIYNAAGAGNRDPVFKPEEAWNIDMKMDDGKPATGNVNARVNESTTTLASCTSTATTSDMNATYLLTSTATACALIFARVY
jgi:type II secretory pathway pseudopilin PulG